jgi:transcriptional regulator with XRE-family HTH domain
MRSNDEKTIRQVIREALRASGRGRRDLEERLHIGRGNLERLTDGTLRITLRHLLSLAELLEVPPTDFLALGCPETMAAARRRLTDWIAPGRPLDAARSPAGGPPPLGREEVAEIVREELRKALAAEPQAAGAGNAGSGAGPEGGESGPAEK